MGFVADREAAGEDQVNNVEPIWTPSIETTGRTSAEVPLVAIERNESNAALTISDEDGAVVRFAITPERARSIAAALSRWACRQFCSYNTSIESIDACDRPVVPGTSYCARHSHA